MEIAFTLNLPRDELSVPVVRHICRDALHKLGVGPACVADIELAVTEACTNVLDHAAGTGDDYEVEVQVDELTCEIRVIDKGSGFDAGGHGHQTSSGTAESGRGIFLMRAMVDDLSFASEPEKGTIVHLVKNLELEDHSLLKLLAAKKAEV